MAAVCLNAATSAQKPSPMVAAREPMGTAASASSWIGSYDDPGGILMPAATGTGAATGSVERPRVAQHRHDVGRGRRGQWWWSTRRYSDSHACASLWCLLSWLCRLMRCKLRCGRSRRAVVAPQRPVPDRYPSLSAENQGTSATRELPPPPREGSANRRLVRLVSRR